jgi:anti-sigma-K factor RskA
MNLAPLHDKLIAAAKRDAPGDRVPYAFEKRIMARIAALPVPDPWALWGGALWRAAGACVAVMVVAGALSLTLPQRETEAAADSEHVLALTTEPGADASTELQ